jgi:DHA1 family multidrug resistance protein-like MFS transporter
MSQHAPVTVEKPRALFRRPIVSRLLVIALLTEVGYAVLNLSTMPVYLKFDRNFGQGMVGLVVTAFLFSEAVFKSPMGHLADRFGAKRLMMTGPILSAISAILTILTPRTGGGGFELLAFVLLRVVDGVAAAMIWPAAYAAMNDAVEDHERQQAMSLLNLCYMLGVALAFPIGGIVNDAFNARWAGLILAVALVLTVSLTVWRLLPDDIAKSTHHESEEAIGFRDLITSLKRIPAYLTLAAVTFCGVGFTMTNFKVFPEDQFRFSETQIGLLIFPGAIAMAGLSVPMSKLGERLGRARAVHYGLGLCALGMLLIGGGMFIPFLRQPWMFAVGGIPVGIGFLITIPAWMASVSDIDPQRRATNIGAVMTAQGVGAILGAPIGGLMYEKLQPVGVSLQLGESFGRYSPFAACALFITLGWVISLKILRDPH